MLKKRYIIFLAIIFLLSIVVAELFLGKNSIPKQQQVKEDIAHYEYQIDSLKKIIESHKNEIELIKNDSLYKENLLRTRYGMSYKGEKVFQLVE